MIARYVAKAEQQETRIEQITSERQVSTDERSRLQGELDAAFRALGRKAEEKSANLAVPPDVSATAGNPLAQCDSLWSDRLCLP